MGKTGSRVPPPSPVATTDKDAVKSVRRFFANIRIEAMNTLTYKGYQGRFEYDSNADIFHGEVLHLNDVVTFQGRSIDELKQTLADSVEDYLALCSEVGKEPEKPFSGRFNIRISPELHQKIAKKAADAGVSLNNWVLTKLEQGVI